MDGKQSAWTPRQDCSHQHEDHHAAERWRQKHTPESIDNANQDGRDKCPFDRGLQPWKATRPLNPT